MAKEEEYRQRADECLTLANQIDSRETRAFLLRMAKAWLHLADEERPSGPARQKRLRPLRKGPIDTGLSKTFQIGSFDETSD